VRRNYFKRTDEATAVGGVKLGPTARVAGRNACKEFFARHCLQLSAQLFIWWRVRREPVEQSIEIKMRTTRKYRDMFSGRYLYYETCSVTHEITGAVGLARVSNVYKMVWHAAHLLLRYFFRAYVEPAVYLPTIY